MHQSNYIFSSGKWQRSLRSFLYALLIASLLWIPTGPETAMASVSERSTQTRFICQEYRHSTLCVDRATGMQITIPEQKNGVNIKIDTGPVENSRRPSNIEDEFEAHGVLTAVVFLDADTGQELRKFNPAIQVKVPYNRANIQAVGGVQNLTLGFLHTDGYWSEFKNVKIHGNRWGGWLSVSLSNLKSFYTASTCPISNRNSLNNLFERNQICIPSGFISWGGR